MTFPQSLRILIETSFDGYAVELRRSTRTYYMPNGDPVAESFDASLNPSPPSDLQHGRA
jgi:hypothetical protein